MPLSSRSTLFPYTTLFRSIHIESDEDLDPISQAKVLARVVEDEGAQLVFTGGKQADWDSSALGPAIAEFLGWPHSDWSTQLELAGQQVRVRHDAEVGTEVLQFPLPGVITTQQGLNEPRYPTLPNKIGRASCREKVAGT